MNESPFSSNFQVYRGTLRIQHTVRSEGTAEEHLARLEAYLAAVEASGQTATEAGLEEGQERIDCTGYVVSVTSKGHQFLSLYSEPLNYPVRGGRIYQEKWQSLGLEPKLTKINESGGNMELEVAQKRGFYHELPLSIIVEKTGSKTERGDDIYRFVRLASSPASPPAAAVSSSAAQEGDRGLCETICSYIENKVSTQQELVTAALRAFAKRGELSDCWETVQHAIRMKLIQFVNLVRTNEERQELIANVKTIGKVLPDGYQDSLIAELDSQSPDGVPF